MGQDGLVRGLEMQIAHLLSETEATRVSRDEALGIAEARLQVLEAYRTAAAERLKLIDDLNARLRTDEILATLSDRLVRIEARIGALEADHEQLRAIGQAVETSMKAVEAETNAAAAEVAQRLEPRRDPEG
jgi:hypothetical protein